MSTRIRPVEESIWVEFAKMKSYWTSSTALWTGSTTKS